ncbi:MAG TPA: class I mannose-6-phosphate isomerase [Symbiobacteriaceae bacterium]|nr:class I mannose-6-phosphate isomerase [Symbiobacteriaceae bacterium]
MVPFNPSPSIPVSLSAPPQVGTDALTSIAYEAAVAPAVIAVDGMWGVAWEVLTEALRTGAAGRGAACEVIWTADYLRGPAELRAHFQPWLTENPVFGRVCTEPLAAYFDAARLSAAVEEARSRATVVIVAGPYSLGACQADVGIYCDLPRAEIIRRQTEAGLPNLGDDRRLSAGEKYKIAYYVEWPLLEAHKRAILLDPRAAHWYADCSDEAQPVVLSRQALLEAVAGLASKPFRCRPFFMPGVWGGQRLKEVADLPPAWPNCAWDFEVVFAENAVTASTGGAAFALPFHLLLWLQPVNLMGELVYRQFGEFFPIRINYLDTMGGTNLSLQVHPHHTYMRNQFGEPIGQDESYYIVEAEPGSKVYLGLKESATQEGLREAVRGAEEAGVPFAVTDYINEFDAKVGDLYLIPAGTLHCSGANNLVLEVSSTPYWYTFKVYDYLRPDLAGKPRPINSEHGFAVIDFTRRTEWVERHLVPKPVLLRQEAGGAEYHLGSTAMTFYAVNRLDIETSMTDQTGGGFVLLTLVKGQGARVVAAGDAAEIGYLETWVVPASVGQFTVEAVDGPCQVVKSYVRR